MYLERLPKKRISSPKGTILPVCDALFLENLYHSPGEAAAIRFFKPSSIKDLSIMRTILKAKPVKEWMDYAGYLSKREYLELTDKKSKNAFLYAVLDTRTSDLKKLNQVRGFVYFYSEREEKFRVKRMVKQELFTAKRGEAYYLEASFALKPGNLKGSGLMSSALRQACYQTHLLLNSPSKPDIQIFAFVDPENLPARRTLEASGFKLAGHMLYDRDSSEESALYLLNWRLLHKKMRKKLLETQEINSP
jgi:hypothetical protein